MSATTTRRLADRPGVVAVLVGIALLLGLAMRLVGFGNSLWIDEFGTLWVVEVDLVTAWHRALEVQGQSPVYYTLIWIVVRLFGESEIALRLPSLLFGVVTSLVLYAAGRDLQGRMAGLLAAGVAWLSFPLVEASVNARSYAMAGCLAAMMIWGFVRATGGLRWGRLLFVAGGVGLFYAHYALATTAVGLAVAYLASAESRRRYPFRWFLTDVGLQLLLVTPAIGQLVSLWQRTAELDWLRDSNYALLPAMLVPLLIPAAPAVEDLVGARRRVVPAAEGTLWILLVATTGVYVALDLAGVHLLAMRYLLPLALPAALLAGLVLARTRTVPALVLWAVVLALTVAQASVVRAASGLPNLRPNQDWRSAVAVLQLELDDHPGAPVLYRSGFVEDDRSDGARSSFVNSPLRSPGRASLVANLVPLTWSWSAATERHLESTVRPAVEEATVFYVLSCDCDTRATGPYVAMLREWINRQFDERFAATELDGGRNIVLIRFEAQDQSVSEP